MNRIRKRKVNTPEKPHNFIMLPTVDFCFKELMQNSKVRQGIISAILNVPPDRIQYTKLMPTILQKEHQDDKFGILDVNRFRDSISKIMNQYGIKVDLDSKIENLSVGMQQRVEILKTLYRGADILILDEPTAVLTPQETEELVKTLRDLASAGKTVLIITHKLKEIKASSDFCTIIRKKRNVPCCASSNTIS